MQVQIVRTNYTEQGVFGVLSLGEYPLYPFCVTLERPWLDNKPNVSCIPTGSYVCKRVQSPRWGNTFEVTDVPGRTHILFHTGNTIKASKGCILLARYFGVLDSQPAVLVSKPTVRQFKNKLEKNDSFLLLISACF